MTTNIRYRDPEHGPQYIVLPDPPRIPIKPIRMALEESIARKGQQAEAAARLQGAFSVQSVAEAEAEDEANEAAAGGGVIPSKALAKKVGAAAEEVATAKLEHRARAHAYVAARGTLIDAIDQHTPAWRDAALTAADRGIARLATAREAALQAAAELTEPLAVLEMLQMFPQTRAPMIDQGGVTAAHVSRALLELGSAIGSAVEALARFRGAEAATAAAEDEKAGEAAARETAGATALAIHAERAARRAAKAEAEASDG